MSLLSTNKYKTPRYNLIITRSVAKNSVGRKLNLCGWLNGSKNLIRD